MRTLETSPTVEAHGQDLTLTSIAMSAPAALTSSIHRACLLRNSDLPRKRGRLRHYTGWHILPRCC
jgi:hypothetical protein